MECPGKDWKLLFPFENRWVTIIQTLLHGGGGRGVASCSSNDGVV